MSAALEACLPCVERQPLKTDKVLAAVQVGPAAFRRRQLGRTCTALSFHENSRSSPSKLSQTALLQLDRQSLCTKLCLAQEHGSQGIHC